MRVIRDPLFDRTAARLRDAGATLDRLEQFINRLRRWNRQPAARERESPFPEPGWNYHDLGGQLRKRKSCIVGSAADGTPVIVVFRFFGRKVELLVIDLHDPAYESAISQKRRRLG